ncbi:MAG: membrane dipeptidase [Verrucomicrobiales bacterium]|jgi:membrane dipeptidase
MHRVNSLIGLILLAGLATGLGQSAEEFFANNIVIDGTGAPNKRAGSALHIYPRSPDGSSDFAELIESAGVNVSILSIRNYESLANWNRQIESGRYRNLRIVREFGDLETAYKNKEYALVFYVQTPWPLGGRVEPIKEWYDDGLRLFQIVYGSTFPVAAEDKLGTGCSREDPDDESDGLTSLGQKVVAELNRLNMIVDVSHCNRQTTLDTIALSKTPVVATHAGCAELTPVKRNKSDEEIRAIAKSGGVFGVTPIGWMLTEDRDSVSIDDFVKHLEHAISVGGIDHVAISTDGPRNGWTAESGHYPGELMDSERRWFHLYDALKKRGHSNEDLAKIFGRNWLRVLKQVLD